MRLFRMNFCQTRWRLVQAGVALGTAALIAGCGNNYRPTIVPISNPGPPAQVTSYAVVVSSASTTAAGNATIIDYSGDSVMATAPIGPGPTAFTLSTSGGNGYTINSDGTLSLFPVSISLQHKDVMTSTIPTTAKLVNLSSPGATLWASDLCGTDLTSAGCTSDMDVFLGSPPAPTFNIPLAPTPLMLVGVGSSGRYFAISQGSNADLANPNTGDVSSPVACNISPSTVNVSGTVTGIESSSNYATDLPILVGQCPVYALESADGSRLFVLNRGSDTISVINTTNNTLDECPVALVPAAAGSSQPATCPAPYNTNQAGQSITYHPSIPLSLTAVKALNAQTYGLGNPPNGTTGMSATAGPVYAEFNSATNQLVVADYDGGTISVIDVSLDEYGNDSATFGTTYTIPVGKNPASVTVLYDGSRAYTANQTDQTVTIVNLKSYTAYPTPLSVTGHPRTVVSTQNSTQGKVYVASPDSNILTIIRTDYDIVDTVLSMIGKIVDVRVTSQNGTGNNINTVSRVPGFGQPCNLPISDFAPTTGKNLTLANCNIDDPALLQ
jgi:YVTN family beta-propeller protein